MAYYLVEGDTGSEIHATISRGCDGEIVDLTGATVTLTLKKHGANVSYGTANNVSSAEDQLIGKAIFKQVDFDPALVNGKYRGEIAVVFPDTSLETVYEIIEIIVREGL